MWELVIGPFDSEADARAWQARHLPDPVPGGKEVRVIRPSGEDTVEVPTPVWLPDAPTERDQPAA